MNAIEKASIGPTTRNAIRPLRSSPVSAANRFHSATSTTIMATQMAMQPPSGTSRRRISRRPMIMG